MLTQCPKCETFFRLSAPQLRAARGMVRCGECDALFNALDYLHEHIPPPSPASTGRTESSDAGQVMDAGTGRSEPVAETALEPITVDNFIEEDVVEQTSEQEFVVEPEPEVEPEAIPETEPEQLSFEPEAGNSLAEENDPEDVTEPGEANAPDPMDILIEPPSSSAEDVIPRKIELDDIEDLPSELREDFSEEPGRSVLSILLWSLGLFVLIVALLVQLGLSFQSEVIQRYPASRTVYDRLCQHLPCQSKVVVRPEMVKLVARDVRHHPRFRDTLLVNGTLVNEAEQTVAYPVLQFELLDTTGSVIGVRQFQPAEYLDKSIDVDQGMPPKRPVHIVLEVLGASDAAVSFEFSFL